MTKEELLKYIEEHMSVGLNQFPSKKEILVDLGNKGEDESLMSDYIDELLSEKVLAYTGGYNLKINKLNN